MQIATMAELIPFLQTAIGPIILISGAGLVLLSMTNRLGRVIDTVRLLSNECTGAPADARSAIDKQVRILWRRARIIRTGIIFVCLSALDAAILVIVIFFATIYGLETAWAIIVLFSLCMLCMIVSLIFFIRDINLSLAALKVELKSED
jgi:Protein of unknown function (DUF2721)